jgi:hypothetical protein
MSYVVQAGSLQRIGNPPLSAYSTPHHAEYQSQGRRDSSPAAGLKTGLCVPKVCVSQDWSPVADLEIRRPNCQSALQG